MSRVISVTISSDCCALTLMVSILVNRAWVWYLVWLSNAAINREQVFRRLYLDCCLCVLQLLLATLAGLGLAAHNLPYLALELAYLSLEPHEHRVDLCQRLLWSVVASFSTGPVSTGTKKKAKKYLWETGG